MDSVFKITAKVLEENLSSRDDDTILILNVWKKQGLKKDSRFSAISKKLLKEELALPKTIERTRRLLQEKYKHLRGELYEKRHQIEQEIDNQLTLNFGL